MGDGERLRLRRLVKQALALPASIPGFRPFRLLLVSNRTLSFLAAYIDAAGAARGLLIEAVETEFDSVRLLALVPSLPAPSGRFDASLLLDADFFPTQGDLLDKAAEFEALVAGLATRRGRR